LARQSGLSSILRLHVRELKAERSARRGIGFDNGIADPSQVESGVGIEPRMSRVQVEKFAGPIGPQCPHELDVPQLVSPEPSVIYSPKGKISQKKLENPAGFWNNVGRNMSSLFQNKGAFE